MNKKLLIFGIIGLVLVASLILIMALSSGPNSPGTMADAWIEGGNVEWGGVNNAKASDNAYATTAVQDWENDTEVIENSVRMVKGGIVTGTDKSTGATLPVPEAYTTYGGTTDLWGTTWTPEQINDLNFGFVFSVKGDVSGKISNYLKATNFGFSIPIGSTIDGIKVEVEATWAEVIGHNGVGKVDHIRITIYYTAGAPDTIPPKWSDNSINSTLAGELILHRVKWTDAGGLSGYIFSFDNGTGTFVNDSWVLQTGTTAWTEVSKVSNTTVGSIIRWMVYANDSSNNWNSTNIFQYITTTITKYEYYDTGQNFYIYIYEDRFSAQTFTVGTVGTNENFIISHIFVMIYRVGDPVTIYADLYAVDEFGKPTGASLANGSIDGTSITDNSASTTMYAIYLTSYELQESTKYAIVLSAPLGDSNNKVSWKIDNTGNYAGGNFLYSLSAGATWTSEANYDCMFEIWGNAVYPNSCNCAGLNEDWEINMADHCVISTACDLGTGTLSFTGSGYTTCDARVDTTNLGDPGANSILYINNDCLIIVD